MVSAPLPEPPGKSTHIAHHLLLVAKIDLPYQRTITKQPHRLCIWHCIHLYRSTHVSFVHIRAEMIFIADNVIVRLETTPSLEKREWSPSNIRGSESESIMRAALIIKAAFNTLENTCPMEGSISSVCVECGEKNDQALYRKFTGGAIQLSQCVRSSPHI